jgi:catechol 2,3-dioxygenase-like lactoylglutathione lyase family enzyme
MTNTAARDTAPSQEFAVAAMRRATLSHLSIPVRNRAEAVRFFVNVLGAEIALDNPAFTEIRVAGTIIGLSEQPKGWTGSDAEFPHYAFEIHPDDFVPMKERLEANGVKTHPIWTRHGVEALMYFRDPSGNLFEFYCTEGFRDADKLPHARGWGGDFKPPIAELSYDWQG